MGAMAEAFVAYAQPLLDQTDGSQEQLQNAFALSQLCYNLALLPEASRDKMLSEMRPDLTMDDEEFDAFRRSIIDPMIRRHQDMFPRLHQRVATASPQSEPLRQAHPGTAESARTNPGTDRYAPCPCGSGEKYKFCCGKKGR